MTATWTKTILVADDCPTNRRLFARLLRNENLAVIEAVNGHDALAKARKVCPHVIILDVMMPGMNGHQVTRKLREHAETAAIPIIMVSARTQKDDLAEGLSAGADEYLFKPIRPREFRLRVQSMVRLREAQLEIERTNASLDRQTRLLSHLNVFCERVLAANTLEDTCRRIVETASELMQSQRVSLLVPDATGTQLQIVHAIGIPGNWKNHAVPLENTIAGEVFTSQSETVVNLADDPPMSNAGRYDSPCFVSVPLISEPLRGRGGPIGVLNVTEKQGDPEYDPEDLAVLRQFSQTAALALHDALTRTQLDETRDSIIISLTRLSEYRHRETGKHIERVQALSVGLAEELRHDPRLGGIIDDAYIRNLHRAAPLHDIGKVAIPDAIFLKPDQLNDEELELMQQHTILGAETLMSVISSGHDTEFLRMAVDIARHHHERYDGTGYPDGKAAHAIPLAARIVCVADCYDAIRMKREYKPARSHEYAARELLKGSGGQFDPRIIQAFCRIEDNFRRIHRELSENGQDRPAKGSWRPDAAVPAAANPG